jgi:hypothetical protein
MILYFESAWLASAIISSVFGLLDKIITLSPILNLSLVETDKTSAGVFPETGSFIALPQGYKYKADKLKNT